MIRLEHPYYLLALLAVPLLIWMYIRYISWKKKTLQKFGERTLVEQLLPGKSRLRPLLKLSLLLLSFIMIIAGLANPESGSAKKSLQHEGIDVALLLDVS